MPMDVPGPSEQRGIPSRVPPVDQFPQEDIREEVQIRVRLAREQEIQRQVDAILERDRLVRENQGRLDEEDRYGKHGRGGESYPKDDPPYTSTYSPFYTNSMLPGEFDEFKETVLASLPGRANRSVGRNVIRSATQCSAHTCGVPQFTQYNGIGDPQKHLKGFLAQMKITTNDMDIYAKAFQNSLTGAALDWYMELPPNSIDSYAHTADAFIFKYSTSIVNKQDKRALMDLQQFPRESLRDFHERYKAILNNIPGIDNKIAYMAFYRGLNYGKLKKALVLKTPLTKDELTKLVNKHIDLENLQRKEGPSGDLREKLSRDL
ncbi:hypothetical protein LIER_14679 [Lithospermum erythrorhizon]|uniref:Retrotransposon gag domain-containing protein n=1 Tax=Lithospermum erythrorhizon TaxID=34254 RepID=A0AAV3Q104_LITER